jgi:hypothetical protein
VKGLHEPYDSICSRKVQAIARKTITFSTTANASFQV